MCLVKGLEITHSMLLRLRGKLLIEISNIDKFLLRVAYVPACLLDCREMGGALSEFYSHIKPKMNDFDVNVR